MMREAALLSSSQWVRSNGEARMPEIYGPEPAHGWCYYFERAGLAAQQGRWKNVVELADVALSLSDHPNDPIERFVFIEGYAQVGDWTRAIELSDASFRVSKKFVGPVLCRLWSRIGRETAAGAEQRAAVAEVKSMFACSAE